MVQSDSPRAAAVAAVQQPKFGPTGSEELAWTSRVGDDLMSRRQRRLIANTYRAAVPVQIADAGFDLPSALAADAEDAAGAITRLDASLPLVFANGDIAPLDSVLLRSESAASSQIEQLRVGARQLAIAELGKKASPNATLVAANVAAMRAAVELADRLDQHSILAMHRALLEKQLGSEAGRWRQEQVWIGGSAFSPHSAVFVPPHQDRVPPAMADLIRFMKRDDLPVLVQAAVAHAQFETIHPFVDGNGRTGRALLHSLVRAKGLTQRVTVPISAGLLPDTGAYFQALTGFRDGDIAPIVGAVARAVHLAVLHSRWLTAELSDLHDQWAARTRLREGSTGRALAAWLVAQPAVDVASVISTLGVSETAARKAIAQAAAAGILVPGNDKSRNRLWVAPEVVRILDEFARRAGRRVLG